MSLLGVAFATPASAFSTSLRRYPYLTDLVHRHVTINWATTSAVQRGVVRYGRPSHHCHGHSTRARGRKISVGTQTETQWRASLSRLLPGARYCYRIYRDSGDLLGNVRSPRFFAQLPRRSHMPYTFAVVGDWGTVGTSSNPDQAALIHQLASSNARFVVMTGDIAYPDGSQRNYGDLVQHGADTSAVFGPSFWPQAGDSIAAFVPPGNHGLNPALLVNWPERSAVESSQGRYRMERSCCVNHTNAHMAPSVWYASPRPRVSSHAPAPPRPRLLPSQRGQHPPPQDQSGSQCEGHRSDRAERCQTAVLIDGLVKRIPTSGRRTKSAAARVGVRTPERRRASRRQEKSPTTRPCAFMSARRMNSE